MSTRYREAAFFVRSNPDDDEEEDEPKKDEEEDDEEGDDEGYSEWRKASAYCFPAESPWEFVSSAVLSVASEPAIAFMLAAIN